MWRGRTYWKMETLPPADSTPDLTASATAKEVSCVGGRKDEREYV